ncbi:hypothetical protein HPB48_009908 [Haemaphysalis longicornis]|uniref:Uncharacterized protein n=1 Tax=Haemaphysalis longicornis TaxID=44386 RepID=A0A9J6H096_HAELO|nr:hypothetical protein HPB48_009908 [Haemaphysalis longicornis]
MAPEKDRLNLLSFKTNIANKLIKADIPSSRRPTLNAKSNEESTTPKRPKVFPLTPDEVRFDLAGHFCEHAKIRFQM